MMQFSLGLRNARLQAIITAIGSGAKLELYSGVRPEAGGAPTTLLAVCDIDTSVGSVNSGQLIFAPISPDTTVDAEGEVSWGRVVNSSDEFVIDLDCGILASSAEVKFSDPNFEFGAIVKVSSFTIIEGNT